MPLEMPLGRTPQFIVGDKVVVVNPGVDKGKQGIVTQIYSHSGDFVYRYNVQFADGISKKYFGFEIDFVQAQSA